MKAVCYVEPGGYEIAERPHPPMPASDEVTISVACCGVCGTDLKVLSDPPGAAATPGVILGHEFAGRVMEIGNEVLDLSPGDRVVVAPDWGCGKCQACASGRPSTCDQQVNLGENRDGGFAEFATVPRRAVYRIPEATGWAEASLIEPLACVLTALRPARPSSIVSAAVVGAGPMGLLAISILESHGVQPLLAFEPSSIRAALARHCGATHTADGSRLTLECWEAQTGNSRGADVVVDAVGHLLPSCMEMAAPGGLVIQLGYNAAAEVTLQPRLLNEKALTIAGSNASEFTFPEAIRFVAQNGSKLRALVTAELPIEQFGEALSRLRHGQEAKVAIVFDENNPTAEVNSG